MKSIRKKLNFPLVVSILIYIILTAAILLITGCDKTPEKIYSAEDFGIETLHSKCDFNSNGVDDYTDLLLGARADAINHPVYDGSYQEEGYPPDNIGVCADVIWRAFKNAGYCLRDMVDKDVREHTDDYPNVSKPDDKIDFRRVKNLSVFFKKYAESLTLNTKDIEQWQPGDIVIFGKDTHIGIVSDKRNEKGQPYIIHNGGQSEREEDYINRSTVTGHYRFNAENLDSDILIAWHD